MVRRMTCAVLALLLSGASHPSSKETSAAETIRYLTDQYRAASVRSGLQISLKYNPPLLRIMWQPGSTVPAEFSPLEQVAIDLRYAHFDYLYSESVEQYMVLVECWHYRPCYHDEGRHLDFDHGEIRYLVKRYASDSIANALNHLATLHLAQRPKDEFDDRGTPEMQLESSKESPSVAQ